MTSRDEILAYLHDYLRVGDFKDYGPQGLQVEGKPDVRKVVSGVSASVALFEEAARRGADLVITHHGILWENESRVVRGGLKRRLELLFEHGITLAGYHLCLDAHPELGNNVLGCRGLELENIRPWAEYRGKPIGFRGDWPDGLAIEDAVERVESLYATDALVFPFGTEEVHSVGLISGGAQGELRQAIEDGLDLFITGEASEFVMNTAREAGIHFIGAGHYATERIGIRALGEHLAARFGLAHEFVDIPNPV
jgi:dinuclear metal center YbgI/SA1388 family protein